MDESREQEERSACIALLLLFATTVACAGGGSGGDTTRTGLAGMVEEGMPMVDCWYLVWLELMTGAIGTTTTISHFLLSLEMLHVVALFTVCGVIGSIITYL